MVDLLNAIISGLALAMPLFLAASGLTLIYGVMRVINFAHGGFFMVGAYVTTLALRGQVPGFWAYLGAALLAGIVVAVLSAVSEEIVFRWLDPSQHMLSLLASYALSLVIAGGAIELWGSAAKTQPQTPVLSGTWNLGGVLLARNDIFMIVIGLLLGLGLWALLNRTPFGKQAIAVSGDPVMAEALGIRVRWVAIGVFAAGGVLAGLAGGLASPQYSIGPGLDQQFVLESFAVVIVGGLGSIGGAFGAALLLGLLESVIAVYAPSLSGYAFYVGMAVVLMLRPQGLAFAWRRRRASRPEVSA
ncbi:branched-chain amino acid ABC transporter permease [Amycolatopsis benzoatilytica]|uniref:branched-chain amino acid ABC transporter permease n=1 Tax=Amycolatopsis benzoatilytica TaxID=346045 RepID=UPI00037F7E70|nr:branched-chain amino acid ABC transporter permease [Amycolatopsis benzoatilytica]